MLLIKHARVIDPVTNTDAVMDILIDQGMIVETGHGIERDCEVIDASGLTAAPGLMDAHVHFRDPGQTWKEDLATG
ncbi:MAG: dihydroorotase, partial [Erysipelotrichaceae bacterium]|nr:dihydroorotase [Erysipelotrichaceae bacterium]